VRLLPLDNYDSFTWNLAQYFQELGAETTVELNDRVSVDWVAGQRFDALVISPGPGRPADAGISLDLVRSAAGRTPLPGPPPASQTSARLQEISPSQPYSPPMQIRYHSSFWHKR
jgi:hypothetical protein